VVRRGRLRCPPVIRIRRVLAVVGAGALVASCASSPALSARDYRAQANRICRDLRRSTAALPRPEPTATAQFVRVGRRSLALQRDALGRIRSLDAPSTDDRNVGQWLGFVAAALDAGAASLTAQSTGDLVAARAANARGNAATAKADEIARLLRLDDCATPVTG
jgi:hypothetical protein